MFTYTGKDPDSGTEIVKKFNDEFDAIEYANDNSIEFREFKVVDSDNEIIYSDKMADNEIDAINSVMFPDEDE